jgi:hypothetical protein
MLAIAIASPNFDANEHVYITQILSSGIPFACAKTATAVNAIKHMHMCTVYVDSKTKKSGTEQPTT